TPALRRAKARLCLVIRENELPVLRPGRRRTGPRAPRAARRRGRKGAVSFRRSANFGVRLRGRPPREDPWKSRGSTRKRTSCPLRAHGSYVVRSGIVALALN